MTNNPEQTAETSNSNPWGNPRVRIAFLNMAIFAAAALVAASHPDVLRVDATNLPIGMALVAGFALSEKLIFHVEARSEAVSYTPTELALAVGLVFLNPGELIVARLLGATVGMVVWRRQPLFKFAFNLANFALETALAVGIVWLIGGGAVLTAWLGMFTGLALAMTIGGILVTAAVAQFEGEFVRRATEQIANMSIFFVPPAAVGAAIAVPMTVDPWLGVPAAVSAPVLWYIVRSHGTLLHRYSDLADVHDFSRIVGDAGNLNQLAESAVERLAAASRAEQVAVRLWIGGESIEASAGFETGAMAVLPAKGDDRWASTLASREIVRLDEQQSAQLGVTPHLDQPLVAPLRDDRGLLGVVVIADRGGALSTFSDDDVDRIQAMIQQLAVAVRKAQFNAQIQYEATHDRLTGLTNRAFFEAWLGEAIRDGHRGAVLLLDLDRFKQVNDAFGHHAGDELLEAIGERIADACTDADLGARFGGDEYAIFLDGLNGRTAIRFAEELGRALAEPITAGPAEIVTTASIGIAVAVDTLADPTELLRRADLAMYAAKRDTTSAVVLYDTELETDDSTRILLLADLRAAIAHDTLQVYFQPQIDIASGRVAGAEALVRWIHPEHGFVNPEEFVELAEQAGLINDLTRSVLRQAATAAHTWHSRGWEIDLSVNISAISLQDELLEPLVVDVLEETGLDANRLCLEITETTMMGDPVRTHRILHRIESHGVRFSVDDFGTGHSSLVNLRNLPVGELKVDRSFVGRMLDEHHDDVIVRSTIDLGHNLGLKVVAEGVESAEILTRLQQLGCDIAQGYHISRPVPPDEFAAFVADHDGSRNQWETPELVEDWVESPESTADTTID